MRREVKYKIKGMNKDSSFSAFSPEFSFENRNIRITTLEGNTTLSVVNEKGTKLLNITGDFISGKVIGNCVVSNNLVLFSTTVDGDDYIYLITEENESLNCKTLYDGPNTGSLNFSINHPIETLGIYENENNIKVYWVDGVNQPRVINLTDDPSNYTENSFDFVPKISNIGESNFIVTKNYSIGTFPSGVIQYCYTYYNKNGQETNIIDVSPLFYTTNSDGGGSPEETVTNSFNIALHAPSREFEFVRIYSILRTSLNATPLCKVVADIEITEGDVNIIDTGNLGYTIDPTDLLYVGGEIIKAGTLNQKDNTLFLGNISVEKLDAGSINVSNSDVETLLRKDAKHGYLSFANVGKVLINNGSTGEYPYRNQLEGNSREFKIFKRGETYRCGLQFQHATGKWSSPVWLKDIKNDIKPLGYYDTDAPIEVTTGKPVFTLDNENIINSLIEKGYKAVRPVVVYPTDADRDVICQGVINPTVYNVGDRFKNITYAQASWFFRPNLPNSLNSQLTDVQYWVDFDDHSKYSSNSIGGILTTKILNTLEGEPSINIYVKDSWAEFRHNYFIPHNGDTRAEIQCIEQYPIQQLSGIKTDDWDNNDVFTVQGEDPCLRSNAAYAANGITSLGEQFSELYAIDQNVVTLNSPELDNFNLTQSLGESTKLRYVGFIPITGNTQDIDIITSTIPRSDSSGNIAKGFDKFTFSKVNLNRLAGRRKLAEFHWEDFAKDKGTENFYFNTYPWHRSGSLNNQRQETDNYRSALLKNQKRSNLFFSTNSCYFNNVVDETYADGNLKCVHIDNPKIVNLDNNILNIKVNNSDKIYRSNIDSLVKINQINIPDEDLISIGSKINIGDNIVRKRNGYYISRSRAKKGITSREDRVKVRFTDAGDNAFDRHYGIDPVSIKYKSSPHIVFSYKYDNNVPVTCPSGKIEGGMSLNNNNVGVGESNTFWGDIYGWIQEQIEIPKEDLKDSGILDSVTPKYSWLWLAELYREVPEEIKFGGTSKQAIENNQWVVAGDTYKLENNITIIWKEGDHYYQRYDCLKTYPYTLEDTNSVVEILSFMCETRVNLDGRYDGNRGKTNNLVMTPNNFNLMNPVYDQQNNFFNYRVAEKQYQEIDDYLNVITWSKTKTFGGKIDTWTNITLASTLELDGNKGRVESIKRLNNDLIAFQERGISQILYNDNVQISTQSGVPVEIANSGKVQGKRYLSSYIGCNNKWSICESPTGLYFIDDNTKGIYLFNGNLTNLSDKLGFSSWTKDNLKENNFISYYDPIESEVLFLNNKECLTYSEKLGAFTSFYDYTSDTIPINMGNRTLLVGDPLGESELKFYEYHAGQYNDFYGNFKNFSVELIVNPEPTKDKIFNTVEFRADAFDAEGKYLGDVEPFSNIQVKNEYQDTGDILLDDINLRKKFRIWRHTIQRDKANKRDRIRNPWVTITLKNENPEDNKVVLHDVVISYFD